MEIGERSGLASSLARLAVIAAVPLLALFAVAFARVVVADYGEYQQKLALERDIRTLKSENTRLTARVDYLNTDTGLELLARQELGWVRPNDTAIVVLSQAQATSATANSTAGHATPTVTPTPHR